MVKKSSNDNDQFGRLYLINSLTHIFHESCKNSTRWLTSAYSPITLNRLNKLASTLINYLIITKLRPNIAHNRTYFDLIEKLKSIKAYVESWSTSSATNSSNNALLLLNANKTDTSSLDVHIDLFRENIDKNLSSFFARAHLRSVSTAHRQKVVTSLHSHIVQLQLIKRLISSGPLMRRKICLGHLITRNFLQILLNSLGRLNDYLAFYFYLKSSSQPTGSLEILLGFLEPALFIVKCVLLNLARPDSLVIAGLPTLFRLNALFNHLIAVKENETTNVTTTAKRNLKQIYAEKLRESLQTSISNRLRLVNLHLQKIFAAFTDRVALINELARFCLDAPFFLSHGLRLFEQILKSLPKHVFTSQLNVRTYFDLLDLLLSCSKSSKRIFPILLYAWS